MSSPKTSKDSSSAISFQESQGGQKPSDSPAGLKTDQCGPAPVLVSRFRALESNRAKPTPATFGPLFSASSPSADLQRSLENRLRARLGASGSPLYDLIWKNWDMPSGPPICALRASGRRTSDSDSIGWPTPVAGTPNSLRGNGQDPEVRKAGGHQVGLQDAVRLVGWPTPMAGTPKQKGYNEAGNTDSSRKTVELVRGWPVPEESLENVIRISGPPKLMAGWATPNAMDHLPSSNLEARKKKGGCSNLKDQIGTTSNSSHAPTENRGQLNPAFVCWLQGFRPEWESCAPTGTPSSRK